MGAPLSDRYMCNTPTDLKKKKDKIEKQMFCLCTHQIRIYCTRYNHWANTDTKYKVKDFPTPTCVSNCVFDPKVVMTRYYMMTDAFNRANECNVFVFSFHDNLFQTDYNAQLNFY